MSVLPKSVEKVIEAFGRLPGVGPKSASRMAYFFLRAPKERAEELAEALVKMKESTVRCSLCQNVADSDPCGICADSSRNGLQICVVEEPLDVVAIESAGIFRGLYFVLGGVISPADGIGPEELRMREFRNRLKDIISGASETRNIEETLEVVVATNPSLEGEATAAYVFDLVKTLRKGLDFEITVSRLARGLPTGADLEYADRTTLKKALEGRTKM
ncbi:recombination protein RecR [Candidatus Dojkabacteria bacterium]|nr:recombination protein RecR [Candidatus Dojkabacteria bacterium]